MTEHDAIKGPIGNDDLRELAEDFADIDTVKLVSPCGHNELQVQTEIINPAFGMPDAIHTLLSASGARIIDFSHVSQESICIYVVS